MKLSSLWLDDNVCIPFGKDNGSGVPRTHVRDSSFTAADGWDIRETLPGTFTITRDGMDDVVTIGGYGYTYVRFPVGPYEATTEEAVRLLSRKGRK